MKYVKLLLRLIVRLWRGSKDQLRPGNWWTETSTGSHVVVLHVDADTVTYAAAGPWATMHLPVEAFRAAFKPGRTGE